ncbi:arsenite methyltransferase-like [Saccoglossus kowalevskii]|uniref:Arsenite methyltransferase n=1 Tax=Saccoglossus kowalevskii TaxID=10224 RepID=A0ABM0MV69_SACKO|nr:PREDICTED: arsenite methyltransferase-like [Saccoglossus kowalevskii]
MAGETIDRVQVYYGKQIQSRDDFQCSIKCPTKIPKSILNAMKEVHDDVTAKYYGCGLCIPSCLEGCSVLDLGSGAGRDCFIASKLVGQHGHVTGVDITEEMVEFADKYKEYHRKQFGYDKSNINFTLGYMEKLGDAQIQSNTYDIIISNCVICLSSNKTAVLAEAFRVLKPGGELYFSDMYSDQPIPDSIRNSDDAVLWGEGLSGALCWTELMDIAGKIGFTKPRLVSTSEIIVKEELQKQVCM